MHTRSIPAKAQSGAPVPPNSASTPSGSLPTWIGSPTILFVAVPITETVLHGSDMDGAKMRKTPIEAASAPFYAATPLLTRQSAANQSAGQIPY